jgi:hypothetical protein
MFAMSRVAMTYVLSSDNGSVHVSGGAKGDGGDGFAVSYERYRRLATHRAHVRSDRVVDIPGLIMLRGPKHQLHQRFSFDRHRTHSAVAFPSTGLTHSPFMYNLGQSKLGLA